MTFTAGFPAQFFSAAFLTGMALGLSLIMAIGPQNAHIMRMGLMRQHLWITVAVCLGSDIVLIAIGVSGLAALGGLPKAAIAAMTVGGALMLCVYGWRAMQRFLRPTAFATGGPDGGGAPITRRQAVSTALAMSWLNPHAWLDTAVLIGTASLAYARPDNAVFGVGAAAGSAVWFVALGGAMALLGRRMRSPGLWRALDGLVAVTMWGCAIWLLSGLL